MSGAAIGTPGRVSWLNLVTRKGANTDCGNLRFGFY